jgi:hypothetical protein
MTPELPANDIERADQSRAGDVGDIRVTGVPPALPRDKRTMPRGSRNTYPLPAPWPQRTPSQPPVQPPVQPPAMEPTSLTVYEAPLVPRVTPEHWLPEPDYWLADHQRIPRPPTRPITRPQRFRRVSRARSSAMVLFILLALVVLGAGMVEAGHLSYQLFNSPITLPSLLPTHATPTVPAKKP